VKVLSKPSEAMPINVNKRKMGMALETELSLRPIALRNGERRARFRIQEGIVHGFRDFLFSQGFTEIRTPKIGTSSAEGGANLFKMDYFGKKAFLAQSPQTYKQTMVGVYERVFEVGPVFRAEKHSTARHLNEYVSLDFEMGFISDFSEIMQMETAMLQYVFKFLKEAYAAEAAAVGIEIPEVNEIPTVRFKDAKEMVAAEYNRKIKDPYDLEPEEEQLIGQLFKDKYGSDFVFVTHYPSKKRPFYAMDDPENDKYTLSFDLLFRGMEVTTGGQRIHGYEEQMEKMRKKGLNPDDFESYLMIHKYGMPPHGGLGIGLERLCMKLFGDNNIRLSSMFPRDINRLIP
jgi:nondiscriminating aspartyl-tRNA synthetase